VEYLPTVEDIEQHLPEIFTGDLSLDQLAAQIHTSRENLERLIVRNPGAVELIEAGRQELEAFLSLRLLMLAPDALNALEAVLVGGGDRKTQMAQVQAAREILDRNAVTAKVSRSYGTGQQASEGRMALPPLEEVLQGVKEGDELATVDQYMALMGDIDAFRKGSAKVKNVTGEKPGDDGSETVRKG
jgi:hypothetical protein